MLYLLIVGPAARLAQENVIDEDNPLLRNLYQPIGWVMRRSGFVWEAVLSYLGWWGVRIG